jgi:cation diffusion facilitator family transporter
MVVLVLNAAVALVKIVIGVRTGALTVLGAALESALDMFNNLIGVMLVDVAGRAPDEDHPYGHDKFETLGALGIVGFLSISCFELLREGITSLVSHHTPHTIQTIDVTVIALTLGVNFFVVAYDGLRLARAVSGGRHGTRRGTRDHRCAHHCLERLADPASVHSDSRG